MSTIGIGLVGCGHIGRVVHLGTLARMRNVKLVALAEPDPQRLSLAHRLAPQAVAYSEYSQLLEAPDVQAVVICLPNTLHAGAAIAALQRKKHVYLEKPLATNLADGYRALEACKRAGVVGMIGFNYRLNRLYQTARRYVQDGRIGKVIGIRSVFSTAGREQPVWKLTRQNGGGALLDLASHHIDLIHYLLGQEVREVFGTVLSRRSEGDIATLQLRLANDVLAQSYFSFNSVEEDRFEIYGDLGKLGIDRYLSLNVDITDPKLDYARVKRLWRGIKRSMHGSYWLEKMRAPACEPSYRAALLDFVDTIRTNRPASPDFLDGYRSLAVTEAAERSARTGRIVSLPGAGEQHCNAAEFESRHAGETRG